MTHGIKLLPGDCLDVLPTLAENSIDACVTDPPYHLVSIVKRFGNEVSKAPISRSQQRWSKTGANLGGIGPDGVPLDSPYGRTSRGFMGKQWDGGAIAQSVELWQQVYRVLKPGAHLLACGGTRTYHRMACAIEDAGFEIRDCIQWLYGSGFPKSHDVSKGIDRAAGTLKIVSKGKAGKTALGQSSGWNKTYNPHEYNICEPNCDAARQWEGWGTALKPACEPIVLARKPLSEKTIAANVLRWGTGAINVNGCRVATDESTVREINVSHGLMHGDNPRTIPTIGGSNTGRWPSNVIHDGSDEVLAGFPETMPSVAGIRRNRSGMGIHDSEKGTFGKGDVFGGFDDEGSAARFFYQAKGDDRCEQNASDVAKCFLGCHRQNGDIAPLIAPTQDELKTAQNVKSAASLCNSCAIDIARVLVAPRQAQSAVSLQFRDIIGERNAQILSQCLALYVEGREGTDTILTIQNLKQLFGSVFHAIVTYTEASDCDDRTAPNESKRFWYTSKADSDDRIGSKHPTVKPLDLMQYLVRLITPKGGTVLDPFAGTGTTGEAAFREGMKAVLIEREEEYQKDIRRRIKLMLAGPDERVRESIKARGLTESAGPLFDKL